MKLIFHGTRGYIDARTRLHRMHSVCEVQYRGKGVHIDCGEDWLGELNRLNPKAMVITHGHPDHAWGLKEGTDFPVYATADTWEIIGDYDIAEKNEIQPRKPIEIRGVTFEAFPVVHSTRAPAVGYRITAGTVTVFYVPDLVYIEDRGAALRGAKVYIGDGATVERSMVRKPGDTLIGHTPVRTQLTWCEKEGVPRAVITHCGSAIVAGDERKVGPKIRRFADERGVEAQIAHDGQEMVLR